MALLIVDILQTKYSYLDVAGRTVVVLKKENVVPEHNVPFQVLDKAIFSYNETNQLTLVKTACLYFYHVHTDVASWLIAESNTFLLVCYN